ncbi:unnamed protein product [Urochloa humidicola]
MLAVASNRTRVSSTVVLTLIFTGWCLASAVPVANARRLQQIQNIPDNAAGDKQLGNQVQELTATLGNLLGKLQGLLQALPKNVQDDLQEVAASLAQARGQLQTAAAGLQGLPSQVQAQLQGLRDLQNPLNQVLSQLQSVAGARLQNVPANLQAQLQTLTVTLQNLLNGLQGLLQLGVPSGGAIGGLQNLRSNGQNVFGLVPGIQVSAGARHKP